MNDSMIWYAKDREGNTYPLGDYGDIIAASEAAVDYIDSEVVEITTLTPLDLSDTEDSYIRMMEWNEDLNELWDVEGIS
jgi:hypothetical protein